jgi:isopentenyldiphosphate isomerase
MTEEIFDIVNEQDEIIGEAPRAVVHRDGLRHRAVHVLVFNALGEVFLQKRSMTKDSAPGKWDSSASGHLNQGEQYDACAIRELREEIGLALSATPEHLFKLGASATTGEEFVWVYRCQAEGPFQLYPEEIETGAWFSCNRVSKWVADRPDDFAPSFCLVWAHLRALASGLPPFDAQQPRQQPSINLSTTRQ